MTTRERYRPLFASEKLMAGPPYRGCRISADYTGTALATLGESTMNDIGRLQGKGGRRAILQRGWRAFATQTPADSNGWIDQGDIDEIRDGMWGDAYPMPEVLHADFAWLWERLRTHGVSIALNLAAVPASDALRRYVGPVPHQVTLYRDEKDVVRDVCPMHAHSDTYRGHPVRKASVRKASLAIAGSNGKAFAELYPIGGWTAERLMREKKNRQIKALGSPEAIARARALGLDQAEAAVAAIER